MSEQVIIVPCSGIGKTYGTVTREAAYILTEELRPDQTAIVPLSLLVLGDSEAQAAVQDSQVITMDGCKLACATINVRQAGGTVVREYAVLDFFRQHRDLKPQGVAELNAGGEALARALAEEIAVAADELRATAQAPVAAADTASVAPASSNGSAAAQGETYA